MSTLFVWAAIIAIILGVIGCAGMGDE